MSEHKSQKFKPGSGERAWGGGQEGSVGVGGASVLTCAPPAPAAAFPPSPTPPSPTCWARRGRLWVPAQHMMLCCGLGYAQGPLASPGALQSNSDPRSSAVSHQPTHRTHLVIQWGSSPQPRISPSESVTSPTGPGSQSSCP